MGSVHLESPGLGQRCVYWFDDTGRGACVPAAWRLEYVAAGWKPVKAKGEYAVTLDKWCEVSFEPVTTTALRLVVQLQADWAAGVHEWKVTEVEDDGVETPRPGEVELSTNESRMSDVRTQILEAVQRGVTHAAEELPIVYERTPPNGCAQMSTGLGPDPPGYRAGP